MRTTCLINSYNYRRFVCDAVDSALGQSRPVDQIVVVDDGSTDGTADLLRDRYGDDPRVEIVSKANGGQLSCFEEGVKKATGDVVFFLDADDLWEPSYVETVIRTYESRPDTDFVFCAMQRFGSEDSTLLPWSEDRALGYSVALTNHKRSWKGTATSALSMRRWVLDRLFPIPFHEDWRIRADDCLVYGADLVGASKYYLSRALVRYRVHDKNHYYGRTWSASSKYRRKLALERFVKTIQDRMGWDQARLADLAHIEFETISRPTLKDFRRYARVVRRADRAITTRIERVLRMAALAFRRRRTAETESGQRERVARLTRELARAKARENSVVRPTGGFLVPRPAIVTGAILLSLMLLTVAGTWVRVADLSQFALNPDESLVVNLSQEGSLAEALTRSPVEPHPPGALVGLHLIGQISQTPFALRLFALIPGILLIPLAFLLGRIAGNNTTGLVAAWLTAFGQAGVLLAGVVRPYSAAVALIMAGLVFFLLARDNPRRRWCVGYAVSFGAAVLLHYSALIPLLATVVLAASGLRHAASESARARRIWVAALVPLGIAAALVTLRIPRFWGSEFRQFLYTGWLDPYFPRSPRALVSATGDLLGYLFYDSIGSAMAILVLIGGVVLWRRGGRGRDLIVLGLLSYGTAVVLSILRIYPLGGLRHAFYLLPFAVIPAAAAVSSAWAWLTSARPFDRPLVRATVGLAIAAAFTYEAASLTAEEGFFRQSGDHAYVEFPVPAASVDGMARFVSERVAPGDVILTNGQTEAMLRYSGLLESPDPTAPSPSLQGRTLLTVPDLLFESEEQLAGLLHDHAPRRLDTDRARLWLLNIGWRSLDDAFPVGGWGRGLLTDGVVMEGAYAAAIPVRALMPEPEGTPRRYRVLVSRDGVHQVRFEDLGYPGSLLVDLASDRLGMTHRGEALPIWVEDGDDGVFGPGDRIEFVGKQVQGIDTRFHEYSDRNVYWLEFDATDPSRMSTWEPAERCDDRNAAQRRRIHLEHERHRVRFSSRDSEDRPDSWYWARLTPLDPEPVSVPLPLEDLDRSQPVSLRIRFRGWSHLPREADRTFTDHVVEVSLDGRSLGRLEWDNSPEGYLFETTTELPMGEAPRLELRVPSRTVGEDPRPRADVVLLDWVKVAYTRHSEAPTGPLRLEPTGDECLAFEGPVNRDLVLYDEAGRRAVANTGTEWIGLQARGAVHAVPDGDWFVPDRVIRDHPSSWRSPDRQADYLIVTHERLRFAIQPLVDLHRQRGLEVEVVDVQDLYDEFNDGIVDPRAIREFFRYTHESWRAPAPRYALLVGDASFDPRSSATVNEEDYDDRVFRPGAGLERERAGGYWYANRNRENHRNLIPTFTYTGSDGQAASDFGFVDFDPDQSGPAMAIGRFPVTEPEEVEAIVAKTLRYVEQPEDGDWRRRVLWISNEMNSFQKRTSRLADELDGFDGVSVHPTDGKTNAETREELLRAFDEGQLLVHFLGHGGRFIWQTGRPDLTDDRDLFTLDDVERIRAGGRLPVVLSMTCYSAPFDHPNADSIGEKLLRVPDRGAIAVVAASWRISPTYEMSRLLTEELTRPGTVGEAFARAKRRSSSRAFRHLFNLLGDPAAPIAVPDNVRRDSL